MREIEAQVHVREARVYREDRQWLGIDMVVMLHSAPMISELIQCQSLNSFMLLQ